MSDAFHRKYMSEFKISEEVKKRMKEGVGGVGEGKRNKTRMN